MSDLLGQVQQAISFAEDITNTVATGYQGADQNAAGSMQVTNGYAADPNYGQSYGQGQGQSSGQESIWQAIFGDNNNRKPAELEQQRGVVGVSGHEARTNFSQYNHQQLYSMLYAGDPNSARGAANGWDSTGNSLHSQANTLEGKLGSFQGNWQGGAADQYTTMVNDLIGGIRKVADTAYTMRDLCQRRGGRAGHRPRPDARPGRRAHRASRDAGAWPARRSRWTRARQPPSSRR